MAKSIFQEKKKQRSIEKRKQVTVLVSQKKKIQLKSTTSKLFMHKPEHTGENLL